MFWGLCLIVAVALVLIVIGSYHAVSTMAPLDATLLVVSISLPVSIAILTLGVSLILFYYASLDLHSSLITSETALLKASCSHVDKLSEGIEKSLDATLKAIEATHRSIKSELKTENQ